ncbi:MAG: ATP-binding protein [Nitrospinota bacterium]
MRVILSENRNEVAVKVTDEGEGFHFEKYLEMNEEGLITRMTMPNGRGIYMGKHYFDNVVYEDGGASVVLTKKIGVD